MIPCGEGARSLATGCRPTAPTALARTTYQRLRPLRVIIQARHQHQLLAARLAELLPSAITDLFQRLDAIGDERRAHHQHLFHAALGQLVQARFGVGFDPLRAAQSRLKRHRPLAIRQAHALGKFSRAAQALGAVTGRQQAGEAFLQQSSFLKQCLPVGSSLVRWRSGNHESSAAGDRSPAADKVGAGDQASRYSG
jgi:hypothetical protein